MAKAYKTSAVVLKKTKLGETDLILTMLSKDGRQIRAVAKGARRPGSKFGARLEPFSVVDLVLYPGKSLDTISDVRCVQTNEACREDLEHSSAASVVAEFLEKTTRDAQAEGRIYDLTLAAFTAIGEADGEDAYVLALAFLVKATAMMGLRPAIHQCAICGEPVDAAVNFDIVSGGALCEDCAAGIACSGEVDPQVVDWVDLLLHATFEELAEVDAAPDREIAEFCTRWIAEHLSLNLKS
ncbi:MAG: DNA repair protein RecO, partial [Coriobacteriaceae bacterium]|nr:DNA repair protein RecO [Coriobacteriaceae bacterium]